MSEQNAAPTPAPSSSRRRALRAGAVTAVAAAGTVAAASSASAAPGQAVLQGRTNSAGATSTALVSSSTNPTLQVRNTGPGAAAAFLSTTSNGFAGGTAAPARYGLSASNTATTAGSGAALAASGNQNTGATVNTANPDRYAVRARNLGPIPGDGGAVEAVGGTGVGLVATSDADSGAPGVIAVGSIVSIGDVLMDGGLEVYFGPGDEGAIFFGSVGSLPTVQQAGTLELDDDGAGEVEVDYSIVVEADLTDASVVVTPKGEAMPGLYADVVDESVISIEGGVPGGTVSFLLTAGRLYFEPAARSATTPDQRRAALVERARSAAAATS